MFAPTLVDRNEKSTKERPFEHESSIVVCMQSQRR